MSVAKTGKVGKGQLSPTANHRPAHKPEKERAEAKPLGKTALALKGADYQLRRRRARGTPTSGVYPPSGIRRLVIKGLPLPRRSAAGHQPAGQWLYYLK